MKTIKIKYHHENPGDCQTTFKEVDGDKYYNRVESERFGCWYTVYSQQGYWENSGEVKNDVVFEVVDDAGQTLFTENNGNLGAFKSIGKKAREIAGDYAERLKLCSHEKWTKWLCEEIEAYGYKGDRDNWLYFIPKSKEYKIIGEYMHLGIKFRVLIESIVHPVCGKTWNMMYIKNMETDACEEICGYHLDIGHIPYIKIKNLSQFKRFLTEGAEFYIVEHCRSEQLTGEHRRVTHSNTTGFYSVVHGDSEHKTLKFNGGKGSFLGWGKSSFWEFRDDFTCVLYSSDNEKIPENLIICIRLTTGGVKWGK